MAERESSSCWVGLGHSSGAALALLWLLHRALARAEAHPNSLLLCSLRDLGALEWACPYLMLVAIACLAALVRRSHMALVRVQWGALGFGLCLTLFGLGSEVGKVDPRLILALLGGVASLHACYVCLLAHAALWAFRLVSGRGAAQSGA